MSSNSAKDCVDLGELYCTLPQGHIRLCKIEYRSDDDLQSALRQPISLRLVTFALVDTPPYDALSYVWGSPRNREMITIQRDHGSDVQMSVTINLAWSLKRATYYSSHAYGKQSKSHGYFWADAICINQEDLDERSAQVAIMGDIYSEARNVLICIQNDSNRPRDQENDLHVERLLNAYLTGIETGSANGAERDAQLPETHHLRADHAAGWTAFGMLMVADWFLRTWVLQEAGLAAQPLVLFESVVLGYRELQQLSQYAETQTWLPFYSMSGVRIHHKWSDWRVDATDPSGQFPQLLSQARILGCTDPRDRVYAVLGHPHAKQLQDCGVSTRISPDYTKPMKDVYVDTSRILLSTYGLKVLTIVKHTEQQTIEDLSWPSWVIRWQRSSELYPLSDGSIKRFRTMQQAARPFDMKTCLQDNILTVSGVIIATVAQKWQPYQPHRRTPIFDRYDSKTGSFAPYSEAENSLDNLKHVLRSLSPLCAALSDAELQLAILRTLTVDLTIAGDTSLDDPVAGKLRTDIINNIGVDRNFLLTFNGELGLGPAMALPGDLIIALPGVDVPLVARQVLREHREVVDALGHEPEIDQDTQHASPMQSAVGEDKFAEDNKLSGLAIHVRLVGEMYLDGWMHGKVDKLLESRDLKKQEICVV